MYCDKHHLLAQACSQCEYDTREQLAWESTRTRLGILLFVAMLTWLFAPELWLNILLVAEAFFALPVLISYVDRT